MGAPRRRGWHGVGPSQRAGAPSPRGGRHRRGGGPTGTDGPRNTVAAVGIGHHRGVEKRRPAPYGRRHVVHACAARRRRYGRPRRRIRRTVRYRHIRRGIRRRSATDRLPARSRAHVCPTRRAGFGERERPRAPDRRSGSRPRRRQDTRRRQGVARRRNAELSDPACAKATERTRWPGRRNGGGAIDAADRTHRRADDRSPADPYGPAGPRPARSSGRRPARCLTRRVDATTRGTAARQPGGRPP